MLLKCNILFLYWNNHEFYFMSAIFVIEIFQQQRLLSGTLDICSDQHLFFWLSFVVHLLSEAFSKPLFKMTRFFHSLWPVHGLLFPQHLSLYDNIYYNLFFLYYLSHLTKQETQYDLSHFDHYIHWYILSAGTLSGIWWVPQIFIK